MCLRCSDCCSRIALSRNSSCEWSVQIHLSILSPLSFTPFVTSDVSMATQPQPRPGQLEGRAKSWSVTALCQEPVPNNVILLHHHPHPGFRIQTAGLVPTTLFVLTFCMHVCVCVWSNCLGNAKFPLTLCGMWHAKQTCVVVCVCVCGSRRLELRPKN